MVEWKEEQCRTNSLQIATSQRFAWFFRIGSIYIYTCSLLFIGEKRDVAFSESFWYLGGANVQCTQYKVERYICIIIWIRIFCSRYQQTPRNILISKEQSSRLIFVGFPFKQNIWFLVVPGNRPRWAKNWNGEPGKSRRTKRKTWRPNHSRVLIVVCVFFSGMSTEFVL